jgi:hypothetical protein
MTAVWRMSTFEELVFAAVVAALVLLLLWWLS